MAAVGVFPRSAVAELVVVAGPADTPRLVDRRRIGLVGPGLPDQAYHAAGALAVPGAEQLIGRWAAGALATCEQALRTLLTEEAGRSSTVVGVGIAAEVKDVPPLARALRSHPLLHVGEGQLSREALAEGAASVGLAVSYLPPRGSRRARGSRRPTSWAAAPARPGARIRSLAAAAAFDVLDRAAP